MRDLRRGGGADGGGDEDDFRSRGTSRRAHSASNCRSRLYLVQRPRATFACHKPYRLALNKNEIQSLPPGVPRPGGKGLNFRGNPSCCHHWTITISKAWSKAPLTSSSRSTVTARSFSTTTERAKICTTPPRKSSARKSPPSTPRRRKRAA